MALFADAFTRADTNGPSGLGSIPGGPAWEVVNGSWRILTNRAFSDTSAVNSPIVVVRGGAGDCDLSVAVGSGGGDAAYIRVADAIRWLRLRYRRFTTSSTQTIYEWEKTDYLHVNHDNPTGSASPGSVRVTIFSTSNTSSPTFPATVSRGHSHDTSGVTHTHTYSRIGGSNTGRLTGVTDTQTNTAPAYQVLLELSTGSGITPLGVLTVGAPPTSLRLRAVGTSVRAYINGNATPTFSVNEGFWANIGRHGIGRGPSEQVGTALDNFRVDTLNSPPFAPVLTVAATVDRTRPWDVDVGFRDPDVGDRASWSAVRFRLAGTSAWQQVARQSSQTVVTIPADLAAQGNNEVQGASRDSQGLPVSNGALAWSASSFVDANNPPPGPGFTAPAQGSTIPAESVNVTISAPSLTALEWQVVDSTGAVVDSGAGGPNTRTFTATGLADGSTVTLRARIEDGGLWSPWAEQTHPVSYTRPGVPTLTLTTAVDADGLGFGLAVGVTNPAPAAGQPTVTHHDVEVRCSPSNPDGDRYRPFTPDGTRVRRDLPAGGAWTDPWTASDVDYEYRAVSHGVNGTTSKSPWTGFVAAPTGTEATVATYDFGVYDSAVYG